MPRHKQSDLIVKARRKMSVRKYHRANIHSVCFHFNKIEDADVIDWIDCQPSKIDAIRQLIRQELNN